MSQPWVTAIVSSVMAILSIAVVHWLLLARFRAMLSIDDEEAVQQIAEQCLRESKWRLVRDATLTGISIGVLIFVGIRVGLPVPVAAGVGAALGTGGTRYWSCRRAAANTLSRVLHDLGRCTGCGYRLAAGTGTCSECGLTLSSQVPK